MLVEPESEFTLTDVETSYWVDFYIERLGKLKGVEIEPFNNDDYAFQTRLRKNAIYQTTLTLRKLGYNGPLH